MTTRRRRRKRQEHILEILMVITLIAMCTMIILGVGHIYLGSNIYKNQHTVETLSKELESLEDEVNATTSKQEEYQVTVSTIKISRDCYTRVNAIDFI